MTTPTREQQHRAALEEEVRLSQENLWAIGAMRTTTLVFMRAEDRLRQAIEALEMFDAQQEVLRPSAPVIPIQALDLARSAARFELGLQGESDGGEMVFIARSVSELAGQIKDSLDQGSLRRLLLALR